MYYIYHDTLHKMVMYDIHAECADSISKVGRLSAVPISDNIRKIGRKKKTDQNHLPSCNLSFPALYNI